MAVIIITERDKRLNGDIDTLITIRERQLAAYRSLIEKTDGMAAGAVLGSIPFDTYDIVFRYRDEWYKHVRNLEAELGELKKRKAEQYAVVSGRNNIK